jgi:predicted dehydrogenase
MASAVAEAGVLFMQSFPKRFDPASHALKRLIADGDLGRVHFVRVHHRHFYGFDPEFRRRWYVDPDKGGGGAWRDGDNLYLRQAGGQIAWTSPIFCRSERQNGRV